MFNGKSYLSSVQTILVMTQHGPDLKPHRPRLLQYKPENGTRHCRPLSPGKPQPPAKSWGEWIHWNVFGSAQGSLEWVYWVWETGLRNRCESRHTCWRHRVCKEMEAYLIHLGVINGPVLLRVYTCIRDIYQDCTYLMHPCVLHV